MLLNQYTPLEFLSFVNGSEKVLMRRKNAPVTSKTNSDEKGPKTNISCTNTAITPLPVRIFEFSQRFWKGLDEAQKRACDIEVEIRGEKVEKQRKWFNTVEQLCVNVTFYS